MLARISGFVVALAAAGFIVLAAAGYRDMAAEMSLPTGGVTDRGPVDAVPTNEAANEALAARARLQEWRGDTGPAPGIPAPAATPAPLQAEPRDTTAPEMQPWVTAAPRDVQLDAQPLRGSGFIAAVTNLPDPDAGFLVQAAGRDWRRFHNTEVTVGGGLAVLAVLSLLGLFLALRGRVRLEHGFSGQWVPRFDGFERFNHWMTAISFILLALTGLVLLYGQFFLRPLTGADTYSTVAYYGVLLHIGFAIPFVLGVLTMIILWVRQNGIKSVDMGWLKKGAGGLLYKTRDKPHAYRFNAGQKLIFWLVVLGAAALTASGITLMFPFFWLNLQGMQLTLILHAIIALAMITLILAHIYIGTVGMEGAFDAMWSGEVDRNWAEEHHDLWMAEDRPGAGARPVSGAGS
jgi:formate dehydrogenase subunit gamma